GNKPQQKEEELHRTEGKSVTMKCNYQTSSSYIYLNWYKQDSDLQAPQFILWKGAKGYTDEHIRDKRYKSRTTDTSTELIIRELTLADTALYYCAVDTHKTLYKNLQTTQEHHISVTHNHDEKITAGILIDKKWVLAHGFSCIAWTTDKSRVVIEPTPDRSSIIALTDKFSCTKSRKMLKNLAGNKFFI
uniref:Ig-like domain-containing protein n=1 Tax=Oryzias latipes TaxID=8090 RepID=A0A3P9JC48_ORYLA